MTKKRQTIKWECKKCGTLYSEKADVVDCGALSISDFGFEVDDTIKLRGGHIDIIKGRRRQRIFGDKSGKLPLIDEHINVYDVSNVDKNPMLVQNFTVAENQIHGVVEV